MLKLYSLTNEQLKRVSEIFMGIGHVSLGSVVFPALIDNFDFGVLVLGLTTALIFWVASVAVARKIKDKR